MLFQIYYLRQKQIISLARDKACKTLNGIINRFCTGKKLSVNNCICIQQIYKLCFSACCQSFIIKSIVLYK